MLVFDFIALVLDCLTLAAESVFDKKYFCPEYHDKLVLPAHTRVFEEVAYGFVGRMHVVENNDLKIRPTKRVRPDALRCVI